MSFAKWVFRISGIYGLLVLTPMFFMEERIGRDYPPAITHPEHFYGFLGVALAWQVGFLVIASDPVRYRTMMIPAILEKVIYGFAAVWLFSSGRIANSVMMVSSLDLVWAALFITSFLRTAETRQ